MNCFKIEEIYAYLEKEITPQKARAMEEHFHHCSRCRSLAEDRRRFLDACSHLPDWPLPVNWAKAVMKRIASFKPASFFWLIAIISGVTLFLSGLVSLFVMFPSELAFSSLASPKLVLYRVLRFSIFLLVKMATFLLSSLSFLINPLSYFRPLAGSWWPVFALDLILLPFLLAVLTAGAIFLWRQNRWGEEEY